MARVARVIGSYGIGVPIVVTRDVTWLPDAYWLPVWTRTPEQQAKVEVFERGE